MKPIPTKAHRLANSIYDKNMSGERIPNHKEKADTSNDSSPQTKWDDLSSVAFAKDIKTNTKPVLKKSIKMSRIHSLPIILKLL